jgi:hypothetical protein
MSSDITRHLHGVAQRRLILADYLRRTGDSSYLGLVWTNAPSSGFALCASLPSRRCRQKIRVMPSQHEISFRLREGMSDEVVIKGRAREGKTGAPIELQSVSYKVDFKGFENTVENPGA